LIETLPERGWEKTSKRFLRGGMKSVEIVMPVKIKRMAK